MPQQPANYNLALKENGKLNVENIFQSATSSKFWLWSCLYGPSNQARHKSWELMGSYLLTNIIRMNFWNNDSSEDVLRENSSQFTAMRWTAALSSLLLIS